MIYHVETCDDDCFHRKKKTHQVHESKSFEQESIYEKVSELNSKRNLKGKSRKAEVDSTEYEKRKKKKRKGVKEQECIPEAEATAISQRSLMNELSALYMRVALVERDASVG